jgi:hypothetical protein
LGFKSEKINSTSNASIVVLITTVLLIFILEIISKCNNIGGPCGNYVTLPRYTGDIVLIVGTITAPILAITSCFLIKKR